MGETEIYMELREEPAKVSSKKRSGKPVKILSAMIIALIIIAVIGYYVLYPREEETEPKIELYYFGINTRWSSHFKNYVVTFENTPAKENVEVRISAGGESRVFGGDDMQQLNDHQFLVEPDLDHDPGETVSVEVYKNGMAIGSREIVPVLTDWVETAAGHEYDYDFYDLRDKRTYDGTERESMNMKGTLNIINSQDSIISDFTGEGTQRIEQSSNDPEMEFDIDYRMDIDQYTSSTSTSEGKTTMDHMTMSGKGDGDFYINVEGAGEFMADLTVEEYFVNVENNNLTDSTTIASGNLEGDVTGTIQIEDYSTGEEIHDNYLGINYPCIVNNGSTKIEINEGPISIFISSRHRMWNVKSLDFQYNTIYYETNSIVNGESTGEDSGYVDDAPKPANITINDVTDVRGLVPENIELNDSFVLASPYGYEIRYRAVPPGNPKLLTEISKASVVLEGEVIREGYGVELILIRLDDQVGPIPLERHYSYGWGDEYLSVNMTRK